MDHILENEGKEVPDLSSISTAPPGPSNSDNIDEDDEDAAAIRAALGKSAVGAATGGAVSAATSGEARSIKCTQCGKVFKNVDLANYHAEKSGHDQFEESTEEIKPLTEIEKKQKLEELRAKMAEKRSKKAAEDAKENQANEALRRKAGRDQTAAQEELKAKQIAKDLEQKRREKIEDAKAKAAIKAQIEADKKARAEKAAKEKALREGREWTDSGSSAAAAPAAPTTSSSSGLKSSEYKETRLQIRLSGGGAPVTLTIPSDQTLHDVAISLASQNAAIEVDTVNFSTTFPRKTFSRAEFGKSLKELGLTPSAVLIAS